MERLWVSFKIAEVGMWEAREQALANAIGQMSTGGVDWSGSECFHLLRSAYSVLQVAEHLKLAVDEDKDLVVVASMDSPAAAVVGQLKDGSLLDLLPGIRTL
jgi:hypothetical protein